MEETLITKVCSVCGEEKPISQFAKNNKSLDGHRHICKCCSNKKKTVPMRLRDNESLIQELEKFTDRELLAEIKRRGWKGNLEYVERKTVSL